jgi:hypothetical protein
MAEQQRQSEQPKEPPKPAPKPPAPVLGSAAESGDPVVHQLLAARDIADRNGDEKAVKAATSALAELGVE